MAASGPDKGGRAHAERTAERTGLAARVEFKGHVPQAELAALYRGAACLVFPSRYEGFGLPALEAMASGTPVVATRAGALPEVTGDAAILVDDRSPAALAGGIERALADRERLVAAGLARAAGFTWRSSGPGRHRTRAAGWTSWCSTCLMLPPGSRCRPGSPPRVPARLPRSTTGRPTAVSPTRTRTGGK